MPIGTGGLGIGGMVVLGLIGWALGIDPFLLINGANVIVGGNQGGYEQPNALPQQQHAPHRHAERRGRTVRRPRARQHRGAVEGHLRQGRPDLPRAEAGDVLRRRRARPAAPRRARWGRSIARTTARSISTPRSSASLRRASAAAPARPAISRKAYVIAHEVGHHVQNLLGILPKVQQAQRASGDRAESNRLQVQVELQADCFAGVWANHAEAQKQVPRSGRHRRGVADRVRDRRRHAAAAKRRARWCRTASPTASPSSASAGSRPASRKAPSRPATRSRRRRL